MAGLAVTKTLIDVDEELLARGRALLGTATTKKDAVNRGLRELVRTNAIREWLTAAAGDGLEQLDECLVLVDATVLAECGNPLVAARLLPLLALDEVATCAAVQYELAGAGDDLGLAALRQVTLRWLPTEDEDLARAAEVQAQLTQQGERQLPWSRLVTAAVAERYKATVLHDTSDYDLIAKVTGQPTEALAVPGTRRERS